jgi:hypothetical protein
MNHREIVEALAPGAMLIGVEDLIGGVLAVTHLLRFRRRTFVALTAL